MWHNRISSFAAIGTAVPLKELERERERFGLCFSGGVKGAGALTLASREAASCGSGVRSSFCVTATQSRTPLIASNRF